MDICVGAAVHRLVDGDDGGEVDIVTAQGVTTRLEGIAGTGGGAVEEGGDRVPRVEILRTRAHATEETGAEHGKVVVLVTTGCGARLGGHQDRRAPLLREGAGGLDAPQPVFVVPQVPRDDDITGRSGSYEAGGCEGEEDSGEHCG